jgi:hypothetical protein
MRLALLALVLIARVTLTAPGAAHARSSRRHRHRVQQCAEPARAIQLAENANDQLGPGFPSLPY